MRSALRYLLFALTVVLVSAVLLSFWLLRTDAGASWLWARAVNAAPGQLEASSFSGSLRHGIMIEGLHFQNDSTSLNTGRLSFSIDPDLFGFAVNVHSLHVHDIAVQTLPTEDREEGSEAKNDAVPALDLPLAIRVNDLLITKAVLLGPDGTEIFGFESLGFDATLADTLTIDNLKFAADSFKVTGDASVGLEAPNVVSLNGRFSSDSADSQWLPDTLAATLDGSLEQLEVTLESGAPSISASGTVVGLPEEPSLDLVVTTSRFPVPPGRPPGILQLADVKLRLTGGIDAYRAELEAEVLSEFAAPLSVNATLAGDLQSLQVERIMLSSTDIDATASGMLQWYGVFAASASLTVQRLNPRRWLADWPETQFIFGGSELRYSDGRLEIDGLQATHSDSQARLSGAGIVDTRTGILDVDLNWQDLQWPLPPAIANIDSRAATLSLQGTPDEWTLQGEIAVGGRDLPQGRFVLRGSGSREFLNLQINDSEVLDGRVVGQLAFDARDGGRWSAQLKTTDTRTTPLAPQWPGRVSVDFAADGTLEPFELDLDIGSLSGEVRGRNLSAEGALRLTREQLRFDDLQVQSGESRLRLDGDWQQADGVAFSLVSASLADLVPGMAGSVEAEGVLKAGRDLPRVTLELKANDVAWQEWHAAELEVVNRPATSDSPFGLTITAKSLSAMDRSLSNAYLSLHGAPESHQLEMALQREEEELRAELTGGASNWRSPDSVKWQGELTSLQVQGRDDLSLTLRENVALQLARNSASTGKACLDISGGGALCAEGRLDATNQYRASINMDEVPLNLLRSFTGTNLIFDQLVSGSMELATGPRGRPSGSGRIDVSPGQILNELDDRLTLRTRAGFASFELQEGQLLAGEISLPFSDAAEVAGTFRVIDITQGESSPIAGHLTAVVRDLGVGARILPQIDEAGGSLGADINIDGTLGAPTFGGGLTIENGRVVYGALGLSLENIQLDSKVLPGNRVELTSTFSAGEGSGRISSSADYLQGRSGGFEVALAGENLRVIDLPDLRMVINPDLQLGIRGDDVRINGKVLVPSARVASVAFVNTGASESEDVVYVGPVQPAGVSTTAAASPLNYSGSVVLELGDNVVIDLDVAEARLRGATTYRWDGAALPKASGGFGVSGKFEAYGQLLEITEGSIRYADVPANNPQLRIRAERDIFGNSQVRRAGVFVSGTAMRPKLEVYTTPATSTDRALTLLVTGSDFNYEQGVGAVDVGTYIAPKLYASYGIGLFDRENVISVRYDLAKGFGIKGTSGRQAAGIDISYTIER